LVSHSSQERSIRTGTLHRRSTSVAQLPQFVLRIVGGKSDLTQEGLAAIPVHWMDNLDEAVAQAISLAKSTKV
jgi:succinyl-CoA synthetase beta subunit